MSPDKVSARASDDIHSLVEQARSDGMVVRRVVVPAAEVVFFKALLEGYEGLATVFADRRAPGTVGSPTRRQALNVIASPEIDEQIDELLADVMHEIRGSTISMPNRGDSAVN